MGNVRAATCQVARLKTRATLPGTVEALLPAKLAPQVALLKRSPARRCPAEHQARGGHRDVADKLAHCAAYRAGGE
jgi:hypothetical protein